MEFAIDETTLPASGAPPTRFETGVRDTMQAERPVVQRLLTLISGKPLPHQRPLVMIAPIWHVMAVLVSFFAVGLGEALLLANAPVLGVVLLVPAWVWMTSCLRRFQAVFTHHASHHTITGRRRLDYLLGDVFNVLAMTQSVLDYRKSHLPHHSKKTFATFDDEGSKFLVFCGFRPGMPREESWALFWRLMVSPRFHLGFLWHRLKLNLVRCGMGRRIATLVWLGALALAAALIGVVPVVLAIVVPLTLLYQISSLVNTLTEHAWFSAAGETMQRDRYAARCWGRFCGDPWQPEQSSLSWWMRMLFVHLPVRLMILPSDTAAHDWHHLAAASHRARQWPYTIYFRQELIDAGDQHGFAQRELWGLKSMLDHVFEGIERSG
ncbi:MAG: fatty acid desaturase [Paracoccaceae bacterium]|nr:fatty acid desaturase [Paracoccaceae bacterium]